MHYPVYYFYDAIFIFIECGQPRESPQYLMLGAKPEERGSSPWHVAIYDISGKRPNLICGGTIIGAQMVISGQ